MAKIRVGIVGTGRMGNAYALNMLKAGHEVYVNDINPKACDNLVQKGAKFVKSLQEIAINSEFIITSLPRNEIVEDIIIGKNGLLGKLNKGSIIVDMSTTLPKTTRLIAENVEDRGGDFLDAPVSGHPIGAINATLTIMVGGKKEVYIKAKGPIFEKLGKNIFYTGPSGTGQALKLVNNLLYNLNRISMCEALVLGEKAGIDPEVMVEAISLSTGSSYAIKNLTKDILKGDFEGRQSSLKLACKTLKLITDFADDLGVTLVLGNIAKQIYDFVNLQGLGEKSPSSVIQFYETSSGVRVRTQETSYLN